MSYFEPEVRPKWLFWLIHVGLQFEQFGNVQQGILRCSISLVCKVRPFEIKGRPNA